MTEDPAGGSTWTSDCDSGCGCLGHPGARSERGRRATQRRATPPPSPDALQILDRRYASGEITKDSYQAMLVDLEPRAGAE